MIKTKEEFEQAVDTEVARRTKEIREQIAKVERNTVTILKEIARLHAQ